MLFEHCTDRKRALNHLSSNHLTGQRAQRFVYALNPGDEVGDASVIAGVALTSATLAETDHALQNESLTVLEDQRTAGITLARVSSSGRVAGAQHFSRGDIVESEVVVSASSGWNGWNTDLHQNSRRVVSVLGSATPTSDGSLNVVRNGLSRSWQASRLNCRREFDGRRQFDDGDIVDESVGVVVWVKHVAGGPDGLFAGLGSVEVVRAGGGRQVVDSIVNAMGSSDHDVRLFDIANTNQSAAAKVSAVLLQTDDPRVRIRAGLHATDNTISVEGDATVCTHADGLATGTHLTSGAVDQIFES